MSIIIGADIVPVASNITYFEKGETCHLIGKELKEILVNTDYRIFNLEVPLTDVLSPIRKHGPVLAASSKSVIGLKALGIDLLTLANNHILDQGVGGLKSTIQILDNECIEHVGAGKNINEARKPYYFEVKGKRFGVYACAEHEFSIASEDKCGANPFDPLESLDHVEIMKESCDYAIVLYHGGKEHYRYPSPNLQKVCRKLVEKGADLVVCQHSHCIGCKEEYGQGTIIYGQGNFWFDHCDNEYWKTSLLIEIKDDISLKYIPIIKDDERVRLSSEKESKAIIEAFEHRSREIKKKGFVENNYKEFSEKMKRDYVLYFLGLSNNFVFRAANKISGYRLQNVIINRTVQKRGLGIRNYIECEAHRELLLKGLEN